MVSKILISISCLSSLILSGCDQRETRLERLTILKDAAIDQLAETVTGEASPNDAPNEATPPGQTSL